MIFLSVRYIRNIGELYERDSETEARRRNLGVCKAQNQEYWPTLGEGERKGGKKEEFGSVQKRGIWGKKEEFGSVQGMSW